MNGYFIQIRFRRAGTVAADRVFAVSDARLAGLRFGSLLALGLLLFLLAPFAMAALTRPETGDKDLPLPDVMSSLPHFS